MYSEVNLRDTFDMCQLETRDADTGYSQGTVVGPSLMLCIKNLADVDLDTAAKAITDGFQDNGLDAIFFDQNDDVLFLVQSKWSDDGTKPLDAEASNSLVSECAEYTCSALRAFQ